MLPEYMAREMLRIPLQCIDSQNERKKQVSGNGILDFWSQCHISLFGDKS